MEIKNKSHKIKIIALSILSVIVSLQIQWIFYSSISLYIEQKYILSDQKKNQESKTIVVSLAGGVPIAVLSKIAGKVNTWGVRLLKGESADTVENITATQVRKDLFKNLKTPEGKEILEKAGVKLDDLNKNPNFEVSSTVNASNVEGLEVKSVELNGRTYSFVADAEKLAQNEFNQGQQKITDAGIKANDFLDQTVFKDVPYVNPETGEPQKFITGSRSNVEFFNADKIEQFNTITKESTEIPITSELREAFKEYVRPAGHDLDTRLADNANPIEMVNGQKIPWSDIPTEAKPFFADAERSGSVLADYTRSMGAEGQPLPVSEYWKITRPDGTVVYADSPLTQTSNRALWASVTEKLDPNGVKLNDLSKDITSGMNISKMVGKTEEEISSSIEQQYKHMLSNPDLDPSDKMIIKNNIEQLVENPRVSSEMKETLQQINKDPTLFSAENVENTLAAVPSEALKEVEASAAMLGGVNLINTSETSSSSQVGSQLIENSATTTPSDILTSARDVSGAVNGELRQQVTTYQDSLKTQVPAGQEGYFEYMTTGPGSNTRYDNMPLKDLVDKYDNARDLGAQITMDNAKDSVPKTWQEWASEGVGGLGGFAGGLLGLPASGLGGFVTGAVGQELARKGALEILDAEAIANVKSHLEGNSSGLLTMSEEKKNLSSLSKELMAGQLNKNLSDERTQELKDGIQESKDKIAGIEKTMRESPYTNAVAETNKQGQSVQETTAGTDEVVGGSTLAEQGLIGQVVQIGPGYLPRELTNEEKAEGITEIKTNEEGNTYKTYNDGTQILTDKDGKVLYDGKIGGQPTGVPSESSTIPNVKEEDISPGRSDQSQTIASNDVPDKSPLEGSTAYSLNRETGKVVDENGQPYSGTGKTTADLGLESVPDSGFTPYEATDTGGSLTDPQKDNDYLHKRLYGGSSPDIYGGGDNNGLIMEQALFDLAARSGIDPTTGEKLDADSIDFARRQADFMQEQIDYLKEDLQDVRSGLESVPFEQRLKEEAIDGFVDKIVKPAEVPSDIGKNFTEYFNVVEEDTKFASKKPLDNIPDIQTDTETDQGLAMAPSESFKEAVELQSNVETTSNVGEAGNGQDAQPATRVFSLDEDGVLKDQYGKPFEVAGSTFASLDNNKGVETDAPFANEDSNKIEQASENVPDKSPLPGSTSYIAGESFPGKEKLTAQNRGDTLSDAGPSESVSNDPLTKIANDQNSLAELKKFEKETADSLYHGDNPLVLNEAGYKFSEETGVNVTTGDQLSPEEKIGAGEQAKWLKEQNDFMKEQLAEVREEIKAKEEKINNDINAYAAENDLDVGGVNEQLKGVREQNGLLDPEQYSKSFFNKFEESLKENAMNDIAEDPVNRLKTTLASINVEESTGAETKDSVQTAEKLAPAENEENPFTFVGEDVVIYPQDKELQTSKVPENSNPSNWSEEGDNVVGTSTLKEQEDSSVTQTTQIGPGHRPDEPFVYDPEKAQPSAIKQPTSDLKVAEEDISENPFGRIEQVKIATKEELDASTKQQESKLQGADRAVDIQPQESGDRMEGGQPSIDISPYKSTETTNPPEPYDFSKNFGSGNGSQESPFNGWTNENIAKAFDYDEKTGELKLKDDWKEQMGLPGGEYFMKLPSKEETINGLFEQNQIDSKTKEALEKKNEAGTLKETASEDENIYDPKKPNEGENNDSDNEQDVDPEKEIIRT